MTKKTDESTTKNNDGVPIDRGWAWMVLVGCFFNAALMVAYNRSQALFFVEYLRIFQESTTTTTLIMGVKAAGSSLMSLVTMHVLLEFLGTRKTVIMGGALFSIAIFVASFAPNIVVLICVHSPIAGIGQTMIHSPALVLISKYFSKRRGLATATASSAISFASALGPILAQYLLTEYGIRGTLLIFSGMTLNILVGAALFRPIAFYQRRSRARTPEEESMLSQKTENPIVRKTKNIVNKHTNEITNNETDSKQLAHSFNTTPGYLDEEISDEQFRRRTFSESRKFEMTVTTEEKLIFASSPDIVNISMVDISKCSKAPSAEDKKQQKGEISTFRKIIRAFDFSLWKKPLFILLSGVSMFGILTRLTPTYIPARVNEIGLSQSDSAILLLIMGVLDFFARIFYGFLADLKYLRVHHIMAIGLVVSGLSCMFMKFLTSYSLLIGFSVVYGIFGSSYQCLLPLVILEFMGTDMMAKTMGFTTLFQGFSTAVAHPIIGGIRDINKSYVPCFYFLGATSWCTAVFLMFEPLVKRMSLKKEMNQNQKANGTTKT